MNYKMLTLDIDGTLRPNGQPCVPQEVVQAVNAVQQAGVKIVVATGRGRRGVPTAMLRGLEPDYWICAAGAQVLAGNGETIAESRMEHEEMYALVDYFENYDCPLGFAFEDGSYVYLEYEAFHAMELRQGLTLSLQDGEDQDRHLLDMPFSAFGDISPELEEGFQRQYGYLGLRFLYYSVGGCDILRRYQDKAEGLDALLAHTGLSAEEVVAVGDGDNDEEILRAAGLGVCVEGGTPDALAAADRTCPPSAEGGIITLCRELWPEAFAGAEAPENAAARG
ncbi:MAG: HAD family hydrolase [Gemmiger sp.]|nr:HAD family hydrolase [Gemmiger sp.]